MTFPTISYHLSTLNIDVIKRNSRIWVLFIFFIFFMLLVFIVGGADNTTINSTESHYDVGTMNFLKDNLEVILGIISIIFGIFYFIQTYRIHKFQKMVVNKQGVLKVPNIILNAYDSNLRGHAYFIPDHFVLVGKLSSKGMLIIPRIPDFGRSPK